MQTKPLNVEIYSDITEDGIWSTTYIGESDTPSAEHTLNWSDWVEQQIEYITVPNKQYIPYEEVSDLQNVFSAVKALRYAADMLERRLLTLDGFDRKAWLKSGGRNTNETPVDQFCSPLKELLK